MGPFRDRSVEENLDLLARMKAGEFPDGARTLRAKIDMQAPNVWLRDPVLYRIRHAAHHQTGDKWCIYPLYDFAHGLSDYLEGITHSLCTLEFEVHRPLYDWILEALDLPRPRPHQYEFARLNLTYTVMSKRKLKQLVDEGLVNGWDDPRLPTISGMRRRGVTASVLRDFAYRIGITKYPSLTEVDALEYAMRDEFNKTALRRLAVLHPIKVVITNYPEGKTEELDAVNNPEDPEHRHTQGAVQSRALHRARRLHGDAAAEIFPAQTGRRSASEIRLHHQVRRGDQRFVRQRHRAALHGRSREQIGRRDLEPQDQGHDPLGERGACDRCRGAALRPALHRAGAGRRRAISNRSSTRTRSRS